MAAVAVVVGLLLTVRMVFGGFEADDYYHRAVFCGSERFAEQLKGPESMFRFFHGDPEEVRAALDVGLVPWWTAPSIKAEFFRPITVQTHVLDYWLWPDHPEWMHLHSLFWFALVVLLATLFYRRMLGPTWLAGAAALLFAMDDAHGTPVGWIANRSTLIAATFGIGCLLAHDSWRRRGRHGAFWVALVLWVLSLCSKEAGIATCAYLFAYALWQDQSILSRRLLTLVPYGVVLVLWRLVVSELGYGVSNVGHYVDPLSDPGRFGQALVQRFPVFLMGQWGISADLWLLAELFGMQSALWWLSVSYLGVLALLFWPLLSRDRLARFFATGMLLSVIPICAMVPGDRLLLFVGLGAFGLLVQFCQAAFTAGWFGPGFRWWRALAIPAALLLVVLHGIVAPALLASRNGSLGSRELFQTFYLRMPFDDAIARQDLVVVNAPMPIFMCYLLYQCEQEGKPAPRAVRTLAPGLTPVTVSRPDERTLVVEPESGYLRFLDSLFRNEDHPLNQGQQIRLARMTATVLQVDQGRPQIVAFSFETPLEDQSLRWVSFQDGRFLPWRPPAIGQQVTLPGYQPRSARSAE